MKAFVIHRAQGVEILAPYCPGFVEDLKTAVPWPDRQWNPESRSWQVAVPYVEDAMVTMQAWYETIEELYPDRPSAPPPPPGRGAHSVTVCLQQVKQTYPHHNVLHVLPDAPPEVIGASFRALAKTYHPDHGGDAAQMVALNEAYARLRSR